MNQLEESVKKRRPRTRCKTPVLNPRQPFCHYRIALIAKSINTPWKSSYIAKGRLMCHPTKHRDNKIFHLRLKDSHALITVLYSNNPSSKKTTDGMNDDRKKGWRGRRGPKADTAMVAHPAYSWNQGEGWGGDKEEDAKGEAGAFSNFLATPSAEIAGADLHPRCQSAMTDVSRD